MSTDQTQASRDAVREELIAYCGQRMVKAQEAGDKGLAYFWLEAQNTQIKLRSPEQIARMEEAMGFGPDCVSSYSAFLAIEKARGE